MVLSISRRQLAVEVLIIAGLGLVLGLFGPFGTWAMPPAVRIAYWVIFGLVGYAIFRPLVTVGRWVAEFLRVSEIFGIGLALVVAALPMTLIVSMLLSGLDLRQALARPGLGQLYFQVWLIGFLTNGLFMLLYRRAQMSVDPASTVADEVARPAATAPISPPEGLADRLPAGFGPVIALEAEDHYVRVHSPAGSALLLMRLRDAIGLINSIDGMEVHRSWWVAREGISTVARNGRSATITLVNGSTAPVARDAMPRVRAAGWLT